MSNFEAFQALRALTELKADHLTQMHVSDQFGKIYGTRVVRFRLGEPPPATRVAAGCCTAVSCPPGTAGIPFLASSSMLAPAQPLGSVVCPLGPLGFECSQHRQTLRPSVDGIRSKALRPFGVQ